MVPNDSQSINDGAIRFLGTPRDVFVFKQLKAVLDTFNVNFSTPFKKFPKELLDLLMAGSGNKKYAVSYDFKDNSVTYQHKFEGLRNTILEQYENSKSPKQRDKAKLMSKVTCPKCGGGRLNQEALSYKIDTYTIHDLVKMDIRSIRHALYNLTLTERQQTIGNQVLKEIRDRLDFLLNVGLDYLNLDREAQTLSGGEAQRIALLLNWYSARRSVIHIRRTEYRLHQRDNIKLIKSLETSRFRNPDRG